MKSKAFALALMLGTAAFAQTGDFAAGTTPAYDGDGIATLAFETDAATTVARLEAVTDTGSAPLVQADNSAPERDARGIAVISDPAVVPAGWNGVAGTAMGGPELDPATGEAVVESYPACTATVTDNCLQAYEVGQR